MVQMVVQLVQHDSIVVLFCRFGLRTNAVIFFQKIAAKTAEPGYVVSIEAMQIIPKNNSHLHISQLVF